MNVDVNAILIDVSLNLYIYEKICVCMCVGDCLCAHCKKIESFPFFISILLQCFFIYSSVC